MALDEPGIVIIILIMEGNNNNILLMDLAKSAKELRFRGKTKLS